MDKITKPPAEADPSAPTAAEIAAQFLPGTHGCHGAAHMASVLAEMVPA